MSETPRKFRGLTKEGKLVYGWYVKAIAPSSDGDITKSFIINIDWSVVYLDIDDEYQLEGECIIEVIPETVGQFIGRTDKNSKEIYAGDKYRWDGGEIGIIEWDEQTSGFCRRRKIHPEIPYALQSDSEEHIEIIGNIHEKRELK